MHFLVYIHSPDVKLDFNLFIYIFPIVYLENTNMIYVLSNRVIYETFAYVFPSLLLCLQTLSSSIHLIHFHCTREHTFRTNLSLKHHHTITLRIWECIYIYIYIHTQTMTTNSVCTYIYLWCTLLFFSSGVKTLQHQYI